MTTWKGDLDCYHIYPTNDLIEHDTNSKGECPCNPTVYEEDDCIFVVHDAMDRREVFE